MNLDRVKNTVETAKEAITFKISLDQDIPDKRVLQSMFGPAERIVFDVYKL